MSETEVFLDVNRPLVWQFTERTFTKSFYLDQIHKPQKQGTRITLFAHPILEMLTMTLWWMIPLVWLPFAALLYWDTSVTSLVECPKLLLYGVGLMLWTVLEYVFHRFLFHIDYLLPNQQWALCLHFLVHGNHHFIPHDPYRLVMPPAMFLSLFGSMWYTVFLVVPIDIRSVLASGVVTGYVMYEMFHYLFHHTLPNMPQWFIELKKNHMAHHYGNPSGQFGVTSLLWDFIGQTTAQKKSV